MEPLRSAELPRYAVRYLFLGGLIGLVDLFLSLDRLLDRDFLLSLLLFLLLLWDLDLDLERDFDRDLERDLLGFLARRLKSIRQMKRGK